MAFINQAVTVLQTLVIALGAGGVVLIGTTLIPLLSGLFG